MCGWHGPCIVYGIMEDKMKAVVMMLLASVVPSTAFALSCAEGPYFNLPEDGATAVPLNAQLSVWRSSFGGDEPMLRLVEQASGVELSLSMSLVDDSGGLLHFVPEENLSANTVYLVERVFENRDPEPYFQFETDDSVDEEAPASPIIQEVTVREDKDGHWGPTDSVNVVFEHPSDIVFYQFEMADNASFENAELSSIFATNDGTSAHVGHDLCVDTLRRDAMDVEYVRLVAIDLAGNRSAVSEYAEPKGCSALGLGGVGWLGLGVLPVLFGRRRG